MQLHLPGDPGPIEVCIPPALLLAMGIFVLVAWPDERDAEKALLPVHCHFMLPCWDGRGRVLLSCFLDKNGVRHVSPREEPARVFPCSLIGKCSCSCSPKCVHPNAILPVERFLSKQYINISFLGSEFLYASVDQTKWFGWRTDDSATASVVSHPHPQTHLQKNDQENLMPCLGGWSSHGGASETPQNSAKST